MPGDAGSHSPLQLILAGAVTFVLVQAFLTTRQGALHHTASHHTPHYTPTGPPHPTTMHDATTHDTSSSSHGQMMMAMYFHGGVHETLWFQGWHTTNATQFTASILLLIAACVVHEAVTAFRVRLHAQLQGPLKSWGPLPADASSQRAALLESHGSTLRGMDSDAPKAPSTDLRWANRLSGARLRGVVCALYAVDVALSYMLMLAVMTFNAWYMLTLVVALAVGHYLFYPSHADAEQASAAGCCVR